VGSSSKAGKMSPQRMLVTTVTDELRLATNFKSKVIGVAIKDRGSILPAGHTPMPLTSTTLRQVTGLLLLTT